MICNGKKNQGGNGDGPLDKGEGLRRGGRHGGNKGRKTRELCGERRVQDEGKETRGKLKRQKFDASREEDGTDGGGLG